MVEDTRRIGDERIVMLGVNSSSESAPRRIGSAKILMTGGGGGGSANLQEKTVTVTPERTTTGSTTESVEVLPDSGYDGMSKVEVSTPEMRSGTLINVSAPYAPSYYYNGDTEVYNSDHEKMFLANTTKTGMAYTDSGYLVRASSYMGNATAADVREGKTFSSGSGIAQTGSLVVDAMVYGASWAGGESNAWTRTDGAANFSDPVPYYSGMSETPSSPFDSIMPWAGLRKVTDNGSTLVEIPKFWYKWTRNDPAMQLQISNVPISGFHVSPAHADRGDGVGERDYVYVGRYHCSKDTSSQYKSVSGVQPKTNVNRSTFRSGIHNLGSYYWMYDFAMFWTIAMLYLVEYADWNSEGKIGKGRGNASSGQTMGASDSMPYHTGTMQSSRSTAGVGVQYRHIEDLWANVFDFTEGVYFDGDDAYFIKNPADFSVTTGGTKVGTRCTTSGTIKSWTNPTTSGFEYALLPASTDYSGKYAYSAYKYSSADTTLEMSVGTDTTSGGGGGLFYMDSVKSVYSSATRGSRLMVLPPSQIT